MAVYINDVRLQLLGDPGETALFVNMNGERMSRQGRDLNQAVTMAESIVEVWKAEGEDGLTERLGFSRWKTPEGNDRVIYTAFLNDDWEPEGFANGQPFEVAAADVSEDEQFSDEILPSSRVAQVELL